MDFVFEIIDKTGRKIHLSQKTWSHITRRHPYMANFLEEIKQTTQNPDRITNPGLDKYVRYYYKYYKHKKSSNKYLLVIVKYLNGIGFIISSYFESYIK